MISRLSRYASIETDFRQAIEAFCDGRIAETAFLRDAEVQINLLTRLRSGDGVGTRSIRKCAEHALRIEAADGSRAATVMPAIEGFLSSGHAAAALEVAARVPRGTISNLRLNGVIDDHAAAKLREFMAVARSNAERQEGDDGDDG